MQWDCITHLDVYNGLQTGRIHCYFHREIGDKTMVEEISEIFKKFTDEDNEIVRRFIEMDPDSDDRKVHN